MNMMLSTIWRDDLLNRRADADFLQQFLVDRTRELEEAELPASFVLNINSAWGHARPFSWSTFRSNSKMQVIGDRHKHGSRHVVAATHDVGLGQLSRGEDRSRRKAKKAGKALTKGPRLAQEIAVSAGSRLAARYIGMGLGEIVDAYMRNFRWQGEQSTLGNRSATDVDIAGD